MVDEPIELPSPEQVRVLQVIAAYHARTGMGPSLQKIAAAAGLRAHSVARYHVLRMNKLGWLTFDLEGPALRMSPHTIRLTRSGVQALERWERLRRSVLARGAHELVLDHTAVDIVRGIATTLKTTLPFHPIRTRVEGEFTVLSFRDTRKRDLWAALILERL